MIPGFAIFSSNCSFTAITGENTPILPAPEKRLCAPPGCDA
jgi:hypothetical protein